jgi:hypothetical protein
MYDLGIKAMKEDSSFPGNSANAIAAPRTKCSFYIGKSAASMEIPYSVSGTGSAEGVYVVWFNRIGTRWELDRSNAVPKRKQP